MNSNHAFCDPFFGQSANSLSLHALTLLLCLVSQVEALAASAYDADWIGLGSGIQGANPAVEALAVGGTNLYAGGQFDVAGQATARCIAQWNGSKWSAVGKTGLIDPHSVGEVWALAVSESNLYAGGKFTNAGGVTVNNIAKWDGNSWSPLAHGADRGVAALAVAGTGLYAGGYFTTAGGVPANYVAKWDGHAWSPLGDGMSGLNAEVRALAMSGTDLYAGGHFATAGGVPAANIAKWDGSAWSPLGAGITGEVLALAVSGSNLYAGGFFTTAGGMPAANIAKWDGRAWSALGSGLDNVTWALLARGTELYAGGTFRTAGGVPANRIAKWDGNAWSTWNSQMNLPVYSLAAGEEGQVFAGGNFSMVGSNACLRIAQANLAAISKPPQTQTAELGSTADIGARVTGGCPLFYQWFFNGNAIPGCTNSVLRLSALESTNVGAYAVIVSNSFGAVTSAPAMLSVIPPVERRAAAAIKLEGEAGSSLNVEYSDLLGASATWLRLDTVLLANPPQYCFDASVPLPPQRFYGAWQSGESSVAPSLGLSLVPAITLTGNIGDRLRVDCIDQFGPTNAWVTLDTAALTNAIQLYFDIAAPGQPPRLYRIVR